MGSINVKQSGSFQTAAQAIKLRGASAWATADVNARVAGLWQSLGSLVGEGYEIPAGALERWQSYADPTSTAAARKDVIVLGDSTTFGSTDTPDPNYSWTQRLRDRLSSVGLAVAGKGFFAGSESIVVYDSPEVNGHVSTTADAVSDGFDNGPGQYYVDGGSPAGHTVVVQFRGTCFRLWYTRRSAAGDFTYSVDGGAAVMVNAYLNGPISNTFEYIDGLSDGLHTVTITNRGGRDATPPASATGGTNINNNGAVASGAFPAGTYRYKATFVFGGGETLPGADIVTVTRTAGDTRDISITVPNEGQDSARIFRSIDGGPYELILTAPALSWTEGRRYDDKGTTTTPSDPGQTPPVSGTTNLNTSAKKMYVALAGMRDTGVAVQKHATNGATLANVVNGVYQAHTAFGLTYSTGSRSDPASYTVDTHPPAGGRVDPVLAILHLGFNDLSAMTSTGPVETVFAEGVRVFAAMCVAADCDGIVISGQLPINAKWATYGAAVYAALRDTALEEGLGFVDFWEAVDDLSPGTSPHLSGALYQVQADFLFDNVLAPRFAPANTVLPAVTGIKATGRTLTCTTGTWAASPAPSYAYQWRRNGTAISGATANSYVLTGADEGQSLTCRVTATNAAGSASAVSNTLVAAALTLYAATSLNSNTQLVAEGLA